jgi:hypothetical protein
MVGNKSIERSEAARQARVDGFNKLWRAVMTEGLPDGVVDKLHKNMLRRFNLTEKDLQGR